MEIIDSLRLEGKEPRVTSLQLKVIVAAKMLLHLLEPDYQFNVSELARQLHAGRHRSTCRLGPLDPAGWSFRRLGMVGPEDPPYPRPFASLPRRSASAISRSWAFCRATAASRSLKRKETSSGCMPLMR